MATIVDQPAALPAEPGALLLALAVARPFSAEFQGVGPVTFAPGRYLYVGGRKSGPGLAEAAARHLEPPAEPLHPIDRVTAHARVAVMLVLPGGDPCRLVEILGGWPGLTSVPGFPGEAPCACRAHLYHMPDDMDLETQAPVFAQAAAARTVFLLKARE